MHYCSVHCFLGQGFGRLSRGNPKVPRKIDLSKSAWLVQHKEELPITKFKSEIVETVSKNQVTMVVSETGSGKTTQVPQFLLEHAANKQAPVKIICTEPRRIAAISVAERVAEETLTKVRQKRPGFY